MKIKKNILEPHFSLCQRDGLLVWKICCDSDIYY